MQRLLQSEMIFRNANQVCLFDEVQLRIVPTPEGTTLSLLMLLYGILNLI